MTHEGLNTATPDQQYWEFSPVAPRQGYYYIKNVFSGKAVRAYDVDNTSTSGDGLRVTVYSITAWATLMWKLIPVKGERDTYYIQNDYSKSYLRGSSILNGHAIMTLDLSGIGTRWEKLSISKSNNYD